MPRWRVAGGLSIKTYEPNRPKRLVGGGRCVPTARPTSSLFSLSVQRKKRRCASEAAQRNSLHACEWKIHPENARIARSHRSLSTDSVTSSFTSKRPPAPQGSALSSDATRHSPALHVGWKRRRVILTCMDDLVKIALASLTRMRDAATGLYSHKTLIGPRGAYINLAPDARYSAITIVGLLAADNAGFAGELATTLPRSLDTLHRLASTSHDPATLAVLSWASAIAQDSRLDSSFDRMCAVVNPPRASSMELGLALTAASHAASARLMRRDRIVAQAASFAAELIRRYSPGGGVFRASRGHHSPLALAMARMTSFASQVYPLHGLSEYARLLELKASREIRAVCDRLCAAQGALGQWWWFYAIGARAVIEGYPVYSVHQDAMAFMALAAAERIGQGKYRMQLERGLRWVYGENELATSMTSVEPPFIYRAIQARGGHADGFAGWSRRQHFRVLKAAWRPHVRSAGPRSAQELEVLHECRSYHLGWLLYAATLFKPSASEDGEQ
jgi:hypothetical protein